MFRGTSKNPEDLKRALEKSGCSNKIQIHKNKIKRLEGGQE